MVEAHLVGARTVEPQMNFPAHLRAMAMRSVQHLTGKSPITRPASLSFCVDGGERIVTSVHLPEAGVYPWVQMTGQGEVALVSIIKLDAD